MKISIIYDNTAWDKTMTPDWGFACLVETDGQRILFDTGAKGDILLANMERMQLAPSMIDAVFISHAHWDHTGGLDAFLRVNPVRVFIPPSFPKPRRAKEVITVSHPLEIETNIHSTGELGGIEQALVVKQGESVVVITGCSHPGVPQILSQASRIGPVKTLIGGLHGFDEFDLIDGLELICPTHCTQHIDAIENRFADKYIQGGAGKIIEL